MNVKYYLEEAKSFLLRNKLLVVGVISGIFAVLIASKKLSSFSKKASEDHKAMADNEQVIAARARYAAVQTISKANILNTLSVAQADKAINKQQRAAKLHLRKEPDLNMEEVIKRLNEE